VSAPPAELSRFSLNQMTIDQWSLAEAVEGCVASGIPWIGPRRHKLVEAGVTRGARLIAESGLSVSSLCRGGFFPGPSAERQRRDEDNRRAVEEAAELCTDLLVLVCGPPLGRDLAAARRMVAEGIERLLPTAIEHGVRLGIEPLHPMMVGERSVIVTLREALDLAEHFDAKSVGVVIDAYHVFWDADLEAQLARAAGRIVGFHVSDWVTPHGDVLAARAMMGDGIIDLRHLRALVDAAGYAGPIEIEVINEMLRQRPGADVLKLAIERYLSSVCMEVQT
jgi:sugar phosphate isomerase/epimerase